MGAVMFYCGRGACALLAGVSAIALTVAGTASRAVAEDITLDPITVVTTKPVQRARPAPPARMTPVRSERVSPRESVQQAPAAESAPAVQPVPDPMPASDTLGAVSTVRQEQINQLMPTRPADLLYGMPGVYVQ